MTIYKHDEIAYYAIDGEDICTDSITESEEKEITKGCIVTSDEIERDEEMIFCDRCEKE